jgi:HlyD family secretion protein
MKHVCATSVSLALLLVFPACTRHATSPADSLPVLVVETVRVAETDLPRPFEVGGIVRARRVAPVASRIMAEVRAVPVKPGDHVRAGQPLVVLDAREVTANRNRATAGHAASLQNVNVARADQRAAESALVLATVTHKRFADLKARDSATGQELDEALSGLRATEARVAVAEARVAEAMAAVDAAAADAAASRISASYATLTAPFDGVVTGTMADPGDMAGPGEALVTVEDTRAFRLEIRLDESRVATVRVGDRVTVSLEPATDSLDSATAPPALLSATVTEVARLLDPGSHDFVAKLDLPPDPDLRSGQYGRAVFPGLPHRALGVPVSALVRQGQLGFVYVIESDGKAHMRLVNASDRVGELVEIRSGLAVGESVVIKPPAGMVDGSPVRVGTAGEARK